MYYCLNLAAEREGTPGCVLIRAAEPLPGSRLATAECRGPGRLCRALEIDLSLSGGNALDPAGALQLREGEPPAQVGVSPRIGIRQAADRPLRFFDEDSAAVSAAPPRAR
jgi:DNA-3-methyladenine glycosylase